MKWRDIADFIVHFLAFIAVVVSLTISVMSLMAVSVHDKEIGRLSREVSEIKASQKNFDNNAIDWFMQLGETVRKNGVALRQGLGQGGMK